MTGVSTDPAGLSAGASLGWSLYCYQSYEILLGHCLGAQSILLRVAGACSKGSESAKLGGLAQRAKCGFCPCCSRATHALTPATYEAGSFDRRKANTVRLWQLYGPMASRTYAAAIYFNLLKYIPSGWNWVAAKREVFLLPVLDSAALRTADTPDQSDSQLALEDARPGRSTPIPPPPASSG